MKTTWKDIGILAKKAGRDIMKVVDTADDLVKQAAEKECNKRIAENKNNDVPKYTSKKLSARQLKAHKQLMEELEKAT